MSMRQDSSGEQHRETAFQKAPPEKRVQDRHVDVSRPGVRGHCRAWGDAGGSRAPGDRAEQRARVREEQRAGGGEDQRARVREEHAAIREGRGETEGEPEHGGPGLGEQVKDARMEPRFARCPHPVTWRGLPFPVTSSRLHPALTELTRTLQGRLTPRMGTDRQRREPTHTSANVAAGPGAAGRPQHHGDTQNMSWPDTLPSLFSRRLWITL